MLILLIVFAVVLALVFEIWFILKFTSVLGGFFAFVLGFAGSGIIIGVFSKIIVPKAESILQEKKRKKVFEQNVKIWSSGNWDFPKNKFYEICQKENIQDINSPIMFKKCMQIAESIVKNEGMPAEYHNLYISKEKVKEYFALGKAKEKKEKQMQVEAYNKKYVTPQIGELDRKKSKLMNDMKSLRNLTGVAKRKKHLQLMLSDVNTEIKNKQEGMLALAKLSSIMSDAYSQPKSDWAILGGIAEGIAGPGAGMAVASQVMRENERIEMANSAARSQIKQQFQGYNSAIWNEKMSLEKYRDDIKILLDRVDYKVVLDDIDGEDLLDEIEIYYSVENCGNSTKIKLEIENPYSVQTKENIKFVVDGVIKLDLYCDDIFMDEVYVALPFNGVKCGDGKATIEAYSKMYMIGEDRDYTLEFTACNLFVIEQ